MTTIIKLTQGFVTEIDDKNCDLAKYEWHYNCGYAKRSSRIGEVEYPKKIFLHKAILERKLGRYLNSGYVADHIDRNKLNNIESNLRELTHEEDTRNRSNKNEDSITGITSKVLKGPRTVWTGIIEKNGERFRIGWHESKNDAIRAYLQKYFEIHGKYPYDIDPSLINKLFLDARLKELWSRQITYNNIIRNEQKDSDPEKWTQIYLLGLISEVDEILRDIKWKRHRKQEGRVIDKTNLGFELADLTKYIISLWEVWGFSSDEMIDFCTEKSEILESALTQEFGKPPIGRNIVIADLDGTVADWRSSFIRWVEDKGNTIDSEMATSMLLDVDMRISYVDYYFMKNRFEGEGEYRNITPYADAISVIIDLQKNYNIYLIVSTARPVNVFHRIWMDTWVWLRDNGIVPDQLRLEKESRVILASKLQETNRVILLDDDPETILRAANSGIKVYGRRQSYNANISHKNVTMVDTYTEIPIESYFKIQGD